MGLFGKLFGSGGSLSKNPSAEVHEASMNFDLANVRIFLERLSKNRGIGLDTEALAGFAAETEIGEEREMRATAEIDGQPAPFRFGVFMDDIDAPDVYFVSGDESLIAAIRAEFHDFCEELEI